MALRLFLSVLLLLLAATLLINQTQGIGSSGYDCCLNHSQKVIPTGLVTSYRLQGSESGCFLRAVVFTTKRNRKICASPDNDAVQKLMQRLDKKAKNAKNAKNAKSAKNAKKAAQTQRPRGRPKNQGQTQGSGTAARLSQA